MRRKDSEEFKVPEKSIIEKSFNMVSEFLTNGLWTEPVVEFAYKFCTNVTDPNLIIDYFSIREPSKSPPGPRVLFHKFMSKEDEMTEENQLTIQGLSCVSLRD